MLLLENHRLRVEIAEPGEIPNNGFRFDRAGFISEVTLDKAKHFCANEPQNLAHPSSGGRGLCCEYKADYSGEVEMGEYYPKFGIGLIRKEEPYCFYHKYQDLKEFPVHLSHGADYAEFVIDPVECLGYAVKITKRISMAENVLYMHTRMENVGGREIATQEYCHNFFSIDGMAISPDYHISLPDIKLKPGILKNHYPTPCNFVAEKHGVAFARSETQVSLADVEVEEGFPETSFCYEVSHTGAKAGVKGCDKIQVSRLVLWAVDHIVSPEVFHTISIEPGEQYEWSRSWTFSG